MSDGWRDWLAELRPGDWVVARLPLDRPALLSLLVLGAAMHLPKRVFGPVSYSVLAAFGHFTGEFTDARLWLVPHEGVLYLTPVFAVDAVVFGTINGLVAARLMRDLPSRAAA